MDGSPNKPERERPVSVRVDKRSSTDFADKTEVSPSTSKALRRGDPESKKQMRVEKVGDGARAFHIEHDLSVSLPPDRTVDLQMYFGGQKIADGQSAGVLSSDRSRISFHERIGSAEETVPPGLYRAKLNISPPLERRPEPLVRTMNQRKAAKDVDVSEVFSDDRTVFEFVAPVGSRRERTSFREDYRSSFLKRGNRLIDAWDNWYERTQKMYDEARRMIKDTDVSRKEKEKRMKEQYRKLLNRLRELGYAHDFTDSFFQRYRNQYLVLPNRDHRMKLRKFNRYLYKKVKHMMPTVLTQTIGGIPPDYPEKYPRNGFSPRLHLKNHMEHFNEERVREIRQFLARKSRDEPPLATLDRYIEYQTRRLYRIPRAVQELATGPQRWELRTNLPGSELAQDHFIRQLYRFTRNRVRMRALTLRHAAPHLDDQERTNQIQKDIEQAKKYLVLSIKRLGDTLDIQLPETLRKKYDHLREPEQIRTFVQRRLSD